MKKKNKIAFTLIELIVVSTIIVFLSASSVFYFFDFVDRRDLIAHTNTLQNRFDELKNQVKNFEISDYTLTFTWGLSYYIWDINTLWVNTPMQLYIDPGNFSFTLSIAGWNNDQSWTYTILTDNKLHTQKTTSAYIDQVFQFRSDVFYVITWYLDNTPLNTIIIEPLISPKSDIILTEWTGIWSNQNNIIYTFPSDLQLIFEKSDITQTLLLP